MTWLRRTLFWEKASIYVQRNTKLIISNSHQGDIGKNLLAEILRQAEIIRAEWEKL